MQIIKFIVAAFLIVSGIVYLYMAIEPFSVLLFILGLFLLAIGANLIRTTLKKKSS